MLDGLWIASAAPAIDAALGSMGARGKIAVLGNARLARTLAARDRDVTLVAPAGRGGRAATGDVLAELPGEPAFAAVVGIGAGAEADWAAALGRWAAATVDGGGLVMVDRGAAVELSRRALCAGLTALEQRVAGRWIVTSGLISRL